MTFRAVVLWMSLLTGCGGRMVQQTTITQLREQDALVMAPELPMGFGGELGAGASSLSAGGGYTATQALGEASDVGQTVIPLTGVLRSAVGTGAGLELVASGSFGSPNFEAGPFSSRIEGLRGVLGRGSTGMRSFLPLRGMVEWGFSFDLGAETSFLARTDTITIETRDRKEGPSSVEDATVSYRIRTHPYVRTGMVLRAPLPVAGVTAIAGWQLQTWPRYWAARSETQTCATFRRGGQECATVGNVNRVPSVLLAVLTPTVGASAKFGSTVLHGQVFANLGTTAVEGAPWGGMVMLEQLFPGPSEGTGEAE